MYFLPPLPLPAPNRDRAHVCRRLCLLLLLTPPASAHAQAGSDNPRLSRKVIVKEEGALVHANPDFTGDAQKLLYFHKYFLFEETEQAVRIGKTTAPGSILGWVRREQVLEWSTNETISVVNRHRDSRMTARIWSHKDDVGRDDLPCYEQSLGPEQATEPFPILSRQGSLVQVAFLWQSDSAATWKRDSRNSPPDFGSIKPHPATLQQRMREALAREAGMVDIVLVLDASPAMKPFIEALPQTLEHLAAPSASDAPAVSFGPVRVGLVILRQDADGGAGPATEFFDLHAKLPEVTGFLSGHGTAKKERCPATMAEGLRQAAIRMNWGPHTLRHVFLIGAGPDSPEDGAAVRELSGEFGARRIQLHLLALGDGAKLRGSFVDGDVIGRDTPCREMGDAPALLRALEEDFAGILQARAETMALLNRPLPTGAVEFTVLEALRLKAINVTPEWLRISHASGLQTGWLRAEEGAEAGVCVFLRRSDLERWAIDLREQMIRLPSDRENKKELMGSLIGFLTGDHISPKRWTIGELFELNRSIPFPLDLDRLLNVEETVLVATLRKQLNKLEVLLLTDTLFGQNEEGWVPLDFLPGAFSARQ